MDFRSCRLALLTGLGALCLLLFSCNNPQEKAPIGAPLRTGHLPSGPIVEASGLAPSLLRTDALWINNDSGDTPTLYQISIDGRELGRVRVEGATATDWEDCASFTYKGQPWLLAADTGDNDSNREILSIWVFPEPDPQKLSPGSSLAVGLAWSIRFRFPDGPRDCESVGVDASEGFIYLISKRTHPPVLYRLPLKPTQEGVQVAEKLGELTWLKPATGLRSTLPTPRGMYANQPCGLSFSQDGRRAAMVSYVDAFLFERAPGQSWKDVFAKEGQRLPPHELQQAEAICISADGNSVFITSEGAVAPLLRYRIPSVK